MTDDASGSDEWPPFPDDGDDPDEPGNPDEPTDPDGGADADETEPSLPRRVIVWIGGLGAVGFFVSLLAPLKDLALASERETEGGDEEAGLVGQRLVFAHNYEGGPEAHEHSQGTVAAAEHFEAPTGTLVFPEDLVGETSKAIILHRLEPDQIESPTNPEWTEEGFVAYSAVCTHLGCSVSWTTASHEVGGPHDHCPCHLGEYDPYAGAEVVGGPPPRPLPQLGVTLNDEGELEIAAAFEGDVGAE